MKISMVVPTYNESENIRLIIASIAGALDGLLDARVVLEATHGAHRTRKRDAGAEGMEYRYADLYRVTVCIAEVGGCPGRHGMVPG